MAWHADVRWLPAQCRAWRLRRVLPYAEKRRLRPVLRQQIEDLRSHSGIRTVIDGERHFTPRTARSRKADPIRTQQRASGPQAGGGQHAVVRGDGAEGPWPNLGVGQRRLRPRPDESRREACDGTGEDMSPSQSR